jgi:hypothetical protein
MIMPGTRWINVDATIVECFRAWGEPPRSANPLYEIVADIKSPAGELESVSSQQRLKTRTHRWRAPDPGDVVPARWDPSHRELRLDLGGDPRYDEKLIKKLGRTLDGSPGSKYPPVGGGGMGS